MFAKFQDEIFIYYVFPILLLNSGGRPHIFNIQIATIQPWIALFRRHFASVHYVPKPSIWLKSPRWRRHQT